MEDKVFFTPGEVVTLKQKIANTPEMIVKTVDKTSFRDSDSQFKENKPILFGITCFWFTDSMEYQEKRFNTKDLIHVSK